MTPDTNLTSSHAASSYDGVVNRRPRPALRVVILIAAIACLGLAMCARTRPPQPNPPATPAIQSAPNTPDGPEQGGGTGTQQLEEGKLKDRERDRFPATKAPGRLY